MERGLTRRSGVALQDFSRRLMRSTREIHSNEWSNEAVPTTTVVEVAEAEGRGSVQDLEKAEESPNQLGSGGISEQCGRLD